MELGPQSHNKDGRLGPNSKMVVYVDRLGKSSKHKLWHKKQGRMHYLHGNRTGNGLCLAQLALCHCPMPLRQPLNAETPPPKRTFWWQTNIGTRT